MSTKVKSLKSFTPVRRKKYFALALTLAGACCCGAAPAMADDTNLIITDGGNGPYTNDGTNGDHNVAGNLILGDQSGDTGTYTITGDSAQTNVNFIPGGNGESPNGALIVGNGGTGNFTQGANDSSDSPTVNVAGDLVLGQQSTSVGAYTLNSGDLTVGGQVAIGGESTSDNTFTQNGGTLTLTNSASVNFDYASVPYGVGAFTGKLAVGGGVDSLWGNTGGTGTYNMNAGTIDAIANGIEIGNSGGIGTMNQSGGEVQTTFLTEGFSGTGSYNLSDGTIESYSETVGYAGTGTFNQSGGTHTIASDLRVGLKVGENTVGQGTYNLTGGTLTSGNTFVGQGETGTFVLNENDSQGTTHTVTGNLIMGALSIPFSQGGPQNPGDGSYTITGNTSTLDVNFVSGDNGPADPPFSNGWSGWDSEGNPTGEYGAPNGALIVGQSGTSAFTQGADDSSDSPTVNIAGDLVLGSQAGSQGQYTLNTGNLNVGGRLVVGGASQNENLFTQNGGTVNITNSAWNNLDYIGVGNSYHTGQLLVGGGADGIVDGGTGTYQMNAGELHAQLIDVGHTGLGTMTQSDGTTIVDTSQLWVGSWGIGIYNLNGGRIDAESEVIAWDGSGTFNQTSGENIITGLLDVGAQYGTGIYNLSGNGSLSAGRTIIGDGTMDGSGSLFFSNNVSILNISGGALFTTGDLRVGVLNSGVVNQSGGIVNASSLTMGEIGSTPNGNGHYNLTGTGQLNVSGNETIGVVGYGQFTQGTIGDAGSTNNTVSGDLILAAFDNIHPNGGFQPRAGEYTLNTGTLSTANTIVGSLGVGNFTQNGGTHTVDSNLVVGDQFIPFDYTACGGNCTSGGPSEGTYTYNGGALTVGGQVIVGNAGTGTFNQNADLDLSTSGGIVLGSSIGGTGTYNLAAGVTLTDDLIVGNAGTGTFNNNGGTHNVAGDLILGNQLSGNGTYNLNLGGTLNVAGSVTTGSTSTFDDMAGGTLTAASIDNQGTFIANGDVTVNTGGKFTNFGTLSGSGTINGEFTQMYIGTLIVDLGGTTQGTEYDYLHITGLATLGGDLQVELYNLGSGTFDPNIGDEFTILFAGGGFGGTIFSNYVLPDLANGKKWSVVYNDYDVTLHVNAVPVPPAFFLLATGLTSLFMVKRRKA